MNDEEFGSLKLLILKYRRVDQIIHPLCRIGSHPGFGIRKKGRATIARLVTKFRGHRRVKGCMGKVAHHPPSRRVVAYNDYSFKNIIVFFLLQ